MNGDCVEARADEISNLFGSLRCVAFKRKFLGIILNNSLNVRPILWIPAVRPLDTPLWEGLPHGDLLYLGCAILLPSPAFARAGDGAVMALGTLWQDHAAKRATPPLFIISHSCLRPRRTANQKEESMGLLKNPSFRGS